VLFYLAHCLFVVLEISFLEPDYSYDEGLTMLSTPIRLQFRPNQNPFNITLSPVTVDTAESMGLGIFINSDTIAQGSRATAGTLPQISHNNYIPNMCVSYTSYSLPKLLPLCKLRHACCLALFPGLVHVVHAPNIP
jgi:hypothetical protein